MQGPSVVGQTDAGLHAAPAPPAEGVAGLARRGGPSDFARRALRGSHYKDHTRAIASNNSCPVWPRPPLPTRGCLLKAPELLHPTQIPTRADAAPKLVTDHGHRNHRTSLAAPCAARIVKTRRARWQPGHSRWRKPRRGHSAGRPISRAPFWPLPSAWGQSLAAARWLARWHLAQPVSQSSQAARHPTWSTSRGASGKGVLNARSSGTLP